MPLTTEGGNAGADTSNTANNQRQVQKELLYWHMQRIQKIPLW